MIVSDKTDDNEWVQFLIFHLFIFLVCVEAKEDNPENISVILEHLYLTYVYMGCFFYFLTSL